jgi:hypothetical protein
MLKKIAGVSVLIQVAALAGVIAQTALFTSSTTTQAAAVQPGETVVAITAKECAKATWPDIPEHCLKRVEARKLITTIGMTTEQ